jgi:hypothetical protein
LVIGLSVSLIVGLSACFTGQRASIDSSASLPTDTEAPADTTPPGATDPAGPTTAAALASLFGKPASAAETASFELRPTTQSEPITVVVTRDATRTLVSIRDVQYRSGASGPSTCRRTTKVCTRGFNAQPISDLNISAQFWGPSVRQELRSPTLASRIGPVTTSHETLAGQAALCIDVPGPQVTDRYCALASGMLAQKTTARVVITLTAYTTSFEESLWAEFPAG